MNEDVLNKPYQEILIQYGKPVKEFDSGETKIVYYGSETPSLADMLYVIDETVSRISISHYEVPKILVDFIRVYGVPTNSMYKYPDDSHDSFHTTVHVWPEKGIAVTAMGESESALIIREDHFLPMNLQKYTSSWGKEYASNSAVLVQKNDTAPTVTIQPRTDLVRGSGIITAEWIVFGMLFLGGIIYIYKKRSGRH